MIITESDSHRFQAKVQLPSTPDGCMVWTAALTADGYGKFGAHKRTIRAHRLSYTLAYGDPPEGLVLDHLCRNRACVRPDHLRPVSRKENTLTAGSESITAVHRDRITCPYGHKLSGANLMPSLLRKNGGRGCLACSRARSARHRARVRKGVVWSDAKYREIADWHYLRII